MFRFQMLKKVQVGFEQKSDKKFDKSQSSYNEAVSFSWWDVKNCDQNDNLNSL